VTEIRDDTTIGAIFASAVSSHADRPFLAIPANAKRGYLPAGLEMSYAQAGARIEALSEAYRSAGYGLAHRVATLLENRPEHVLHTLALNMIGVCCVPINPDYRAGETAYLLEHSKPDLVLTLSSRGGQMREALAQSAHKPPVAISERFPEGLTTTLPPAAVGPPRPETPASILYTSGTTGRPKGCILSHGYVVSVGAWYAALGGLATLRQGQERIYNPLPLSRKLRRRVADGRHRQQLRSAGRASSPPVVARDP
jgi:crotonobetaine/carnitine-CoA ligase